MPALEVRWSLAAVLCGCLCALPAGAWAQQVEVPVTPGGGPAASGAGGASVGSASGGSSALPATPGGAGSLLQGSLPAAGGVALPGPAALPDGSAPALSGPVSESPQAAGMRTPAPAAPGSPQAPVLPPSSGAIGPSGGDGVRGLELQIQDLEKAQRAEGAGAEGAVRSSVGRFFHGEGTRRPAGGAEAPAAALPDVSVLGTEGTLREVERLVGVVHAAQQPAWYRFASRVAAKHLSPARAAAEMRGFLQGAHRRGPAAVKLLAQSALDSAASGQPGSERAVGASLKALGEWDVLLSQGGRPYIENLSQVRSRVERGLAQALAEPGLRRAAPSVAFAVLERTPLGVRLRAEITEPRALPSAVEEVPAALAVDLSLLESALDGASLGAPPRPLMDAFLAASADEGLGAAFRARRAEGRAVMESLWLALGDWLRARSAAAGRWWRRAWTALLELLGLRLTPQPLLDIDPAGLEGPVRSYEVTQDPRPAPVRLLAPMPVPGR